MKRQEPGPGQESVWDYPRPPRIEDSPKLVEVFFNGRKIASSRRAKRVLETSHPPVYYLPPEDVDAAALQPSNRRTFCEWKGQARYYTIRIGEQAAPDAAWFYPDPTPAFAEIRDYIAFYPGRMERCLLDGETVQSQPGDFYGGWITPEIVGPFKGGAGTTGW